MQLNVNGRQHELSADPDTPLLYVLMDDLGLRGPRFGCGLAQCGSCSVLLDGKEIRACVTPLSAIGNGEVTTLEGLPAHYAKQRNLARVPDLHPVQAALIEERAPQCGYCYNGITVKAAELLATNDRPSEADIRSALDGHLCRCGTYPRVMKAVQRAAAEMRK